ncbi:HD domain-containing protein [Streptomyces thermocarboxydus]
MDITFGGATGDLAHAYVREILHPAILHHSVRVWLLADHLGLAAGPEGAEREALAVACLFHDSGTAAPHDGAQRFEVEGADAARAFLSEHGWPDDLGQQVWEAVALHTSRASRNVWAPCRGSSGWRCWRTSAGRTSSEPRAAPN